MVTPIDKGWWRPARKLTPAEEALGGGFGDAKARKAVKRKRDTLKR